MHTIHDTKQADIRYGAVHVEFIRKTLMKELLEKQYPISDVEFQNIIIWLNISIRRITNFFYLNDEDIDGEGTYDTEIKIAREYL